MKAIFLDRDGTLNLDKEYLIEFKDFELLPGTLEALKIFENQGFSMFIVTNQSGIARGYFTEAQLHELHDKVKQLFGDNGIHIQDIACCPHLKDGTVPEFSLKCNCRKPSPGLIEQLADKYPLDLPNSFVVGDKLSDAQTGAPLGIKGILLKSGINPPPENGHDFPVFENLLSFAKSLE